MAGTNWQSEGRIQALVDTDTSHHPSSCRLYFGWQLIVNMLVWLYFLKELTNMSGLESMSTIAYKNIYFQNLIYIELGGILFGKHCFRRNALLLIALGSPFLWNLFGRVFLKADISYFWRNRISLLINIFPITFQNFEMSYHTFCQWVYFAPCTLLIKAAIYEKLRIIVKVNKHPTLE